MAGKNLHRRLFHKIRNLDIAKYCEYIRNPNLHYYFVNLINFVMESQSSGYKKL